MKKEGSYFRFIRATTSLSESTKGLFEAKTTNCERVNQKEHQIQEEFRLSAEHIRRIASRFTHLSIYLSYWIVTIAISLYLLHILTVLLRVSGCTGAPCSSVTTNLYFNSRSKYSDIPLVSNRESKPQRPTAGMYKPINHFRKPERNVYLEILIIINIKNELGRIMLE